MAIERFEEALKQYIQEESQKMKDASVQSLEGSLTEDSIKAAARLLNHQSTMASTIIHSFGKAMDDLTRLLEEEGYNLPPANILSTEKFEDLLTRVTQVNNTAEASSEAETLLIEFQPKYTFSEDLLEISNEDFNTYERFINEAIKQDPALMVRIQEAPILVKRKLINAGIRLNRRITTLDSNGITRPKGTLSFQVSEILPHFTYKNIVLLRNNLGNIEAFKNLQPEIRQMSLKNLGLNPRTYNCLERCQILDVEQILQEYEVNIDGFRNFGEVGFHDLLIALAANKIIPEAKI